MSILEAILLGIVQGLTEFLPISSSGHLILVPWLQDYDFLLQNPRFHKTFDVALHAGTLVAAISYFRRDVVELLRGFFSALAERSVAHRDQRLAVAIAIATLPAFIAGGLGEKLIADELGEPWMIALQLIFFGLLLGLADRLPEKVDLDHVTLKRGLIIGLAQVLALAPGTSRSGITITCC
jgi:undecaprenyl-diphosphatase